MMSTSKRRSTVKIYDYFKIFIVLLCINQIRSESAAMSKEGLREEQLLPVRIAREAQESGIEGSGDDESIPIRSLRSRIMERMTLKEEDNKISDGSKEDRSKEMLEEGSGSEDTTPKTAAILSAELNNTAETFDEDASSSESSSDVETTTKEDEETTTESKVTEINLDTTTVKEETTLPADTTTTERRREPTTEAVAFTTEITEEITTEGKEVTALPEIKLEDRTEAETTTAKPETTTVVGKIADAEEETEAVTEVVQVKHVKPVFATEEEEKVAVEEPETEAPTTRIPTVTEVTLIENENLTAGTDTLLMKINSRLLDSKETVLESSKDPSRLGTYIVISLILLSFLSLIGFILMKRRVQKRRKKSNMDPETLDTEKALLSLSEYKDHPEGMDEGKIKNNEITPIVIKSNTQINKFEKNTNFSSPKNLNTKANEKNVEKDNVLKKTSDNLTHVIIEDPTKDLDEEKVSTNAEKLIVRTHLDQDSIPKKPVIVNRTSLGCVPVSQD